MNPLICQQVRGARRGVRRGAAAVEFALTAPILFALVLGAIEFSRANMLVHTASIAATEAARRSIVAGATASDVRLKALSELANVGVVDATVDVSPKEIDDDTTQVTVNLTVPVTLRNGYGLSRVFLGKAVFKSVTLQREGQTEDVTTEVLQKDGMQISKDTGSSTGNSGTGNSGTGSSSSNNSGSSSSGSNSGSGSSNSGSGSSNSGSGSSGSGSSGSGTGGFWGALKALLGL